MKENDFRRWLERRYKNKRVVQDHISRCKRVERDSCIDLDAEYSKDQCASIIEKYSYSIYDVQKDKLAPTGIVIDGDKKNGLASLKSAIKRYSEFKNDL